MKLTLKRAKGKEWVAGRCSHCGEMFLIADNEFTSAQIMLHLLQVHG